MIIGESTTMTTEIIVGLILFGCLITAVVLGIYLRRLLPEHYLGADTKDAVKLAMGLVATMSALGLGPPGDLGEGHLRHPET